MQKVTVTNQLKDELHVFAANDELKTGPGDTQHGVELTITSVRAAGRRYANQQGQFTPDEAYSAKLIGEAVVFSANMAAR